MKEKQPIQTLCGDELSEKERKNEELGRKYDQDRPRFDLIPAGPLRSVAKVLHFGAKKYAPNNWQKVENGFNRYMNAALGHLNKRLMGERIDADSGLPHLACAACNVLFALWFDQQEEEEAKGPKTP